uniref:Uncharacterized protein n=1 Tax=Eutreptiella gymnastica TaxID=73025 RepID=A0A7S4G835_9EUGL
MADVGWLGFLRSRRSGPCSVMGFGAPIVWLEYNRMYWLWIGFGCWSRIGFVCCAAHLSCLKGCGVLIPKCPMDRAFVSVGRVYTTASGQQRVLVSQTFGAFGVVL